MYETPKTISRQNQKNKTQHHNFIVLLSTEVVCKTITYFPPEQKTDSTAQLEMNLEEPISSGYPAHLGLTWRDQFLLVTQPV
jgi:hypothetical protein